MEFPKDQIDELKAIFGSVEAATEGGVTYLLMRGVTLPPGCSPARCDLLFCPGPRDSYPSRLYFSEQVRAPKALNWNAKVRILDRTWVAHSWKPGDQKRLAQVLAAHLEALR